MTALLITLVLLIILSIVYFQKIELEIVLDSPISKIPKSTYNHKKSVLNEEKEVKHDKLNAYSMVSRENINTELVKSLKRLEFIMSLEEFYSKAFIREKADLKHLQDLVKCKLKTQQKVLSLSQQLKSLDSLAA